MIEISGGKVRRRDHRIWFLSLGVFFAVFLFTFLSGYFRAIDSDVEAASLANFDPGYIISDYQMGNYTSMSEEEIQSFLTSKNGCNNRDYNYYQRLTASTGDLWHFENGHFICLSEEKFGDGEVIGSGDTAAHIIWQAAQDYKINPQVILVLLQKESSLITDPIPNKIDYRKAAGYGCPDTAACSSKYYGFKNQVRNAAALFRTVLDGGWTNYPLGNNYVQYNPNAACGGSIVNIRSLATSALYRYTPYQPNAGAIAAGYGTAPCGAYGNRNFYLYFQDWFGGITSNGYTRMDNPRYLSLAKTTEKIDPYSLKKHDSFEKGFVIKFSTKVTTRDGKACLRSEFDTMNNNNLCILLEDLTEFNGLEYIPLDKPRDMYISKGVEKFDSKSGTMVMGSNVDQRLSFVEKAFWQGRMCLRDINDSEKKEQQCFFYEDLQEIKEQPDKFETMLNPRVMSAGKNIKYYDMDLEKEIGDTIPFGSEYVFNQRVFVDGSEYCLRTMSDYLAKKNRCMRINGLKETFSDEKTDYVKMANARSMKVLEQQTFITTSGYFKEKVVEAGSVFYFTEKTYVDGKICLRTIRDKRDGLARCVLLDNLDEDLTTYVPMAKERIVNIKKDSVVVDLGSAAEKEYSSESSQMFVEKTFWNGKMCLRTKEDADLGKNSCFYYDTLDDDY